MTEIRTRSYLLHPPLLDETGLLSALRWYAAGFAERSGITVDLDLPEGFERLPLDTETALFRIVQEHGTTVRAWLRLLKGAGSSQSLPADSGRLDPIFMASR
jgi:two-component system, NarL family, sensor kinase